MNLQYAVVVYNASQHVDLIYTFHYLKDIRTNDNSNIHVLYKSISFNKKNHI